MRKEILDLLKKAGDTYISGEDIAEKLGVSRTAVWKHIKELRRAGYDIVS
ncbi:HTH domain-containing protein, partial [uncultured Selenomonas sp.]